MNFKTSQYETNLNLATLTLIYCLDRLADAEENAPAEVTKWKLRVRQARTAFTIAQRQLVIDAIGVAA